jgi:hypothetical protein
MVIFLTFFTIYLCSTSALEPHLVAAPATPKRCGSDSATILKLVPQVLGARSRKEPHHVAVVAGNREENFIHSKVSNFGHFKILDLFYIG